LPSSVPILKAPISNMSRSLPLNSRGNNCI
jgi:hypothetical protein